MLYKLLSVSKCNKVVELNIGDYIQALASSQYYPHIDGFLDRDEDLKNYNGEPCKIIMNGWYMHNPMNWPPSNKIIPLFVAFHINVLAKKELTSPTSISYLKRHTPIGCRDIATMNMLKEKGVDAYFSGCMTLTLGKKYYNKEKDNKVYIVDPLLNAKMNIGTIFMALKQLIKYPYDVIHLANNKMLCLHHGKNILKKIIKTALYHKEYSRVFSRKLIMEAVYVCQQSEYYSQKYKTDKERLDEAERLVQKYAKAKLVITSRIHCALPCLSLETPVLFLRNANDTDASSCRFGGLIDLFNIITVKNSKLAPEFSSNLKKGEIPINKPDWRILADSLDRRCKSFITNQAK